MTFCSTTSSRVAHLRYLSRMNIRSKPHSRVHPGASPYNPPPYRRHYPTIEFSAALGAFCFHEPVTYELFQCILIKVATVTQICLSNRLSTRADRALRSCDSPRFAFGNIWNHGSNQSQAQHIPEGLLRSRCFFSSLGLATAPSSPTTASRFI